MSVGMDFLQVSDGRRAYVHASAFGGGSLMPGEVVNVVIIEDPQSPGKWQARSLQRGPLAEVVASAANPGQVPEDGMVVEWRHEGGYGFVAMDDGRRVYIHHSVFGGGDLQVGLRLRVQTKPDGRNPGKWCVAAIVQTDLQNPTEIPEEAPTLPHPSGATVTDWDSRGFGFLQSDDGRRVYVHHSAFGSGDLVVGERVSVVIIPDQRNPGKLMGQTLARDGGLAAQGAQLEAVVPDLQELGAMSPGLESAALTPQEWLSGTVAEWHEERGYGFIELEDGRRLYVHHTAFGGGSLLQGSPCEAVATADKVNYGKWSAAAVRGDAVVPRASSGGEPALKRSRAA